VTGRLTKIIFVMKVPWLLEGGDRCGGRSNPTTNENRQNRQR